MEFFVTRSKMQPTEFITLWMLRPSFTLMLPMGHGMGDFQGLYNALCSSSSWPWIYSWLLDFVKEKKSSNFLHLRDNTYLTKS